MHSSLAVTTQGLPLGLVAVKFWTRKKFRVTKALKRKVNPTRVPIELKESVRWLETYASRLRFSDGLGVSFTWATARATSSSFTV